MSVLWSQSTIHTVSNLQTNIIYPSAVIRFYISQDKAVPFL
jgi:hypothetical protein